MKKFIFILLAFFCLSCKEKHTCELDLRHIKVVNAPEVLSYQGRIGQDFDSALDSLKSYRSIKTEISTELIETDFCYDDRVFNIIVYVEHRQSNIEYDYVYDVDVLDSYGNYFVRVCTLPD